MSKALRCNRCKTYYAPYEEKLETAYIPRVVWRNAESAEKQQVTRAMEDLDLCAACAHDFDLFMKGWPLYEKEGRRPHEMDQA